MSLILKKKIHKLFFISEHSSQAPYLGVLLGAKERAEGAGPQRTLTKCNRLKFLQDASDGVLRSNFSRSQQRAGGTTTACSEGAAVLNPRPGTGG